MITIYSADWCQPCKQLKKMLDNNEIEYTVIDIDKAPETARSLGIRGVPTIINELGERRVGAITLAQVKELIS